MLKLLFIFINLSFAKSLYFTTSYQKASEKKEITTKQHMFTSKPYVVRYWDMDYNLTLKKCEKDLIHIEYETFFTTPGKKEFVAAGIWSGKLTDKMEIKTFSKNGKLQYKLTIKPESISDD